jgi:alkaline phosphatase D
MAPWVKSLAIAAFSVIVFLLVLGIFLFAVLLSIFPFSQFVRAYWGFFVVGSAFAIVLLVISLVKKSKWESETNAKKCDPLMRPKWMLFFAIGSLALWITMFIVLTTFAYRTSAYPHTDLNYVMIGHVDHNSAVILVRNTELPLGWVQYKPDDGKSSWDATQVLNFEQSADFITKFRLSGLASDTKYVFQPIIDGFPQSIMSFSTTPVPGTAFDFSFTIGSCILAKAFMELKGPARMLATDPDFNMFIGDFIYADHPYYAAFDSEFYYRKFRNVIGDPSMTNLLTAVPSVFMFDDHEFDDNWDLGNQDPLYKTAVAAWELYNGNANPNVTRAGSYYYSFTMGQTSFFVIDARSYRSSDDSVDDENKTMLQEQQLNDLFEHLLAVNSTAKFKFLVSSVPWSATSEDTDTWSGFLTERQKIFDFLRTNKIEGVVLLSGDRHYAGVFNYDIGFPEMTVSPIDAFPGFPITLNPNLGEDIVYFDIGKNYFGKVDVSFSGSEPQVTLSVYADDEAPVSFTYKLSELTPK